MPQRPKYLFLLAGLFILFGLPMFAAPQNHQAQISEDEIKKHFSKGPDCEGVDIDNLDYFDFVGDGNQEAVVVASTCATGTAGPDVHALLRRQPDGSLAALKVPEPSEKQYRRALLPLLLRPHCRGRTSG